MIDRNFNVSIDWTAFEEPKKIKKTNPEKKRTRMIDTSLDYYFSEVFKKAMSAKTPHLKFFKSDCLREYVYFEIIHFLYQNKNEYFRPREIKDFILTNEKLDLLKIENIGKKIEFHTLHCLDVLKRKGYVLTRKIKTKREPQGKNGEIKDNLYSCSSKFDFILENNILNNENFRKLFFNKQLFRFSTLHKINNILKFVKEHKFCSANELHEKLYFFYTHNHYCFSYLKKLQQIGLINSEGGINKPRIYWCNF